MTRQKGSTVEDMSTRKRENTGNWCEVGCRSTCCLFAVVFVRGSHSCISFQPLMCSSNSRERRVITSDSRMPDKQVERHTWALIDRSTDIKTHSSSSSVHQFIRKLPWWSHNECFSLYNHFYIIVKEVSHTVTYQETSGMSFFSLSLLCLTTLLIAVWWHGAELLIKRIDLHVLIDQKWQLYCSWTDEIVGWQSSLGRKEQVKAEEAVILFCNGSLKTLILLVYSQLCADPLTWLTTFRVSTASWLAAPYPINVKLASSNVLRMLFGGVCAQLSSCFL